MDKSKVLQTLDKYAKKFEELNIMPIEFPLDRLVGGDREANLRHCYGMIEDLRKHVETGKMDKAFRWLGFIQGCLWSHGIYTIDEMRYDNMP